LLQSVRSIFARLFSFSTLLTALVVTLIYFFCKGRDLFVDPDLWWHLRDAEYLIRSHAFIHADMYSFTVGGRPWINSEWLSEMAFYCAWRWFGPRGVLLLTICLIESVALGVCWLGWQRTRNIKPALLACCASLLMISVSIGPRTVFFGWLCLIVEIFLLQEFREGRDRLWLLPPLFVVWINLHGTWPIGIVYLVLFVACGMFQAEWGAIFAERWPPAQRKKLLWIAGLCVLALFLNPYGFRLVVFPFQMLYGHTLMIASVEEWQTLDFHSVRGKFTFAIIASTLVLTMARSRKWRLNDLLFTCIAVLAAFTYSRLLVLAALVVCPLLATELDYFEPYDGAQDKPILNFAFVAFLVAAMISRLPTQPQLQQQIAKSCPQGAAEYLRAAKLDGRVMNELSWGGYLEWSDRSVPVFIDSRSEIFDPWGVLQDYIDVVGIKRPLEVTDQYKIRYALFPRNASIVYLLTRTPGWSTVYQDDTAVVLHRDQPH
jgi:hypothetical protein